VRTPARHAACRYEFDADYAEPFADFLLPMLDLEPTNRATARQLLHHPWLAADAQHAALLADLGETPRAADATTRWAARNGAAGGGGGAAGGTASADTERAVVEVAYTCPPTSATPYAEASDALLGEYAPSDGALGSDTSTSATRPLTAPTAYTTSPETTSALAPSSAVELVSAPTTRALLGSDTSTTATPL
jgi:serine/threonine protein kinase